MSVEFVFKGVEGFAAGLERMVQAADVAGERAIRKAAELVNTNARGHITSRSGSLAGSMQVSVSKVGFGSYEARTGPTAPYTRAVELGKRGYRHRPPHPFYAKGYHEAEARFGEMFRASWAEAVVR